MGRDVRGDPREGAGRAGAEHRPLALVHSSGFVPVEARLQRPEARPGIVLRGELVDLLRESADVSVVVVTGPPGYGKTTLLSQWSEEDERPFSWLTLDGSADDPRVLVTYLVLALQRQGDVDPGVLEALSDEATTSSVLLPRLGRMLARTDRPFVLVLDDADTVGSPEVLAVLTNIADHLGAGSQLAIAARASPGLPWGSLRTHRRLVSIGTEQLRLTPAEARAVLAASGVELPPDEVRDLLERTEGWPAGVYLAARSVHLAAQRLGAMASFGGPETAVGGYLRGLLDGLPPEHRRFLVQTSLLTRLCGPLCDAVLGTTGSSQVLRDLDRANLFVVRLDDREDWYRYHHLFADVLADELATENPAETAELHRRASRWLETAGDIDEAVQHAMAASDTEDAARLVWTQAGPYLASGRAGTLRRWLDRFNANHVLDDPRLSLTAAWCALDSGRPADPWRGRAHGTVPAGSPDAPGLAAAGALLDAHCALDGIQGMREDVERTLAAQAVDDPWRPYALYLSGVCSMLVGELEQGRSVLEGAEQLAVALEMPVHQALCQAQCAVLAVEEGDWDGAGRLSQAASDVLEEHAVPDSPTVSLVHCVTTLLLARTGRVEPARKAFQRSMRMVAAASQGPPWLAVEVRFVLSRAHLLMGDTTAARVLLSEAERQMHACEDAVWLRERLEAMWRHVETFPLATGVGPTALTSAELRVLQLLPTHLSFKEIGKQLHVSRNTVKTEAIAAYRKLGVSSRSEAVERAISLGMIQS